MIQAELDWWASYGPFPVVIPEHGGTRWTEAEQWQLFQDGATKAGDLASTPHSPRVVPGVGVVGCGIDLAPYEKGPEGYAPTYVPNDPPSERDRLLRLFDAIGTVHKRFGLSWGGDWHSWKDRPHGEVPGWESWPLQPVVS
jgi:hypothetical protein